MKKGIHPAYHDKAKVTCSCGEAFTLGSTSPVLEVEICSKCHPFFTGKEKMLDVAGKVERFKARRDKAAAAPKTVKKLRIKKIEKEK